jgi:hypothetical protein
MSRRVSALLTGALATAALAGCMSGGAGPTPSTSTSSPIGPLPVTGKIYVSPVDALGRPKSGYHISTVAGTATCQPGSDAIGRAYRCTDANVVYDPCWASTAGGMAVLCLAAPWQKVAARLTVSGSPGPPPGSAAGEPWGIALLNGWRCTLLQGGGGRLHGTPIDYSCGAGRWVLQRLVTGEPVWHAQTVTSHAGRYAKGQLQEVTGVWYGLPSRPL